MRLPAHLLVQLRVGVGVGAVLLAGCDVLDEAKGAIAGGSDEEVVAAADPEPKAAKPEAVKPAEAAPKAGLADKIAQTVDAAKVESVRELPRAPEPEPEAAPEPEPEDVTAFVPFGGSTTKPLPRIKPRKSPRPPIAVAETPDEPCDPAELGIALGSERPDRDPCPACGRG